MSKLKTDNSMQNNLAQPKEAVQRTQRFASMYSGLKTGESQNIGGSSAYHVDIKFKELIANGDWKTVIEIMDSMSKHYADRGYRMEFSNTAVSGKVWNHSASEADKMNLAKQAVAAHNHSAASTGFSMDFYIAQGIDKKDPNYKSRHDTPTIKNQDFALAMPIGGSANFLTAGNYGNFVQVKDADGKSLYNMGHGDKTKTLPKNFTFTGAGAEAENKKPPEQQAKIPVTENKVTHEQAQQNIEKKGAKKTYEDLMQSFGQNLGDGGGGGFVGILLFMVVMAAAGQELSEERASEVPVDKRGETLDKADEQRKLLQQSPPQTNAQTIPNVASNQKLPVTNIPNNENPAPLITPSPVSNNKTKQVSPY
jgi:hypothetical protein